MISLLQDLVDRELSFNQGVLFVTDGARGLHKASRETISGYGLIQRCQWHKRENIVSYLPQADQNERRKKLQRACREPTYEAANERLRGLHADLQQINRRAARSLEETLEDTLTLHRLGLFEELGRNLNSLFVF